MARKRYSHFATGLVEVHNRTTNEVLTCRYDGETIHIAPGEFAHMTPNAARKAIAQNRIMGTEDPYNPDDFESKVFVVGKGFRDMPRDPVTVSQEPGEAINRRLLEPEKQQVVMNTFRSMRPERRTMPNSYAVTRDDDTSPEVLSQQMAES